MNFKTLYILSLLTFLSFTSEGFTAVNWTAQTVVDTLNYDTSSIEQKTFEDLKERYSGEEFIYQRTIKTDGWWTRFKRWLSEFFKSIFDIKDAGQASKVTDYMINIAAVIICLLVIYFIYKAIINKEGQWVFGKSSDKHIIPVTSVEHNLEETNFEALIASAEENINYRIAIRYYYLWLLKQLNETEIIEYDVEKTNSDYQYEIKDDNLRERFAYTSYLYNYIWYGEFNVDDKQYQKAKNAFTNLLNTIA